jgi:hypothetical protein
VETGTIALSTITIPVRESRFPLPEGFLPTGKDIDYISETAKNQAIRPKKHVRGPWLNLVDHSRRVIYTHFLKNPGNPSWRKNETRRHSSFVMGHYSNFSLNKERAWEKGK